jgi:antitoxin component YwqK of YwqJK toxin-antitoxin module
MKIIQIKFQVLLLICFFVSCNNREKVIALYIDGRIKQEGYKNNEGKIDGTLFNYYKNGIVSSKINFTNGIQEGEAFYYDSSGKLTNVTNFRNSKLNGKETHYYENGNIKWVKYFVDNIALDHDTAFYPDGNKLFISDFDSNGKLKTIKYYNKNGVNDQVCKYENGYHVFYYILDI